MQPLGVERFLLEEDKRRAGGRASLPALFAL
jgi:hypothetical protein